MSLFRRSQTPQKKRTILNDEHLTAYGEIDTDGNLYWKGEKVRTGGMSDAKKNTLITATVALVTATILALANLSNILHNTCVQFELFCQPATDAGVITPTTEGKTEAPPKKVTPKDPPASDSAQTTVQ